MHTYAQMQESSTQADAADHSDASRSSPTQRLPTLRSSPPQLTPSPKADKSILGDTIEYGLVEGSQSNNPALVRLRYRCNHLPVLATRCTLVMRHTHIHILYMHRNIIHSKTHRHIDTWIHGADVSHRSENRGEPLSQDTCKVTKASTILATDDVSGAAALPSNTLLTQMGGGMYGGGYRKSARQRRQWSQCETSLSKYMTS